MTDTIKAIETSYAGCRFRSRLEARWAVFFDKLGVKWLYEPQGFELPSGECYLPDFHLPELGLWVEVKGDPDGIEKDERRYAEAAMMLPGYGLMFLGEIPDLRAGLPQHFVVARKQHCCGKTILCLDMAWADMLTATGAIQEIGLPCTDLISHTPGRLPALKGHGAGRGGSRYNAPCSIAEWPMDDAIVRAYTAARSARFEHGERG